MIKTNCKAFIEALQASVPVARKNSIPILANVRVTPSTITAADLDQFSIIQYDGKGKKDDFLIPYHRTLDVLKGETGELTLEYVKPHTDTKTKQYVTGKVKLTAGGVTFEFESLKIANFPQLPEPAPTTLTMTGEEFKGMLTNTRYAISDQESRYTLNGALLQATSGGNVLMVATDGRRLSLDRRNGEGSLDKTIVLRNALDWLAKNVNGSVSIGTDEMHQTFITGNKTMITRKLSGQFPNYEAVIPRDPKVTVKFESATALLKTLNRVAKCADAQAVIWEFGEKTTISAKSIDRGSASAKLECVVNGTNVKIGWNSDFIADYLKVVGDGPFSIAIRDNQSAAMFSHASNQMIVMPMRM